MNPAALTSVPAAGSHPCLRTTAAIQDRILRHRGALDGVVSCAITILPGSVIIYRRSRVAAIGKAATLISRVLASKSWAV